MAEKSTKRNLRATGRTTAQLVAEQNRWRDNFNPLRGLTIARVVQHFEQAQRGEIADLQWLYQMIERRYPVLRACRTRRVAALRKLDWDIKIVSDLPAGAERLAEEQQQALRQAYEAIRNFREALGHIALAEFRGFTILQKHPGLDGVVRELHWLPQWNWVRDGMFGSWVWNPAAQQTSATALPAANRIADGGLPRDGFVIRECTMPINEVALIAFVQASMGLKDWAAFVEIFGLPGGVVTMPQDVPSGKEDEYETAAASVASGGNGVVPYGTSITFPSSVIRTNGPFKEWLEWNEKDVVLAATGGKLTMLTESGSGTLAGGAHQDTFDEIAAGEAQEVSEVFQQDFDRPILETLFPGQPVHAYFELAAVEQEDADKLASRIVTLAGAGYRATREEVSEKLGIELDEAPDPEDPKPPANDGGAGGAGGAGSDDSPLTNRQGDRAGLERSGRDALVQALAEDLEPLRERIRSVLAIQDPAIMQRRLAALLSEIDSLGADIQADPALAGAMASIQAAGMINGFADRSSASRYGNSFNPGQARDEIGRWTRTGATAAKHGMARARFDGKTLKMEDGSDAPAHTAKLGIPPAWTGVHVNPDPTGALQAIGLDAKGRVQRVYSAEFMEGNAARKFARNKELLAKQEKVYAQNRANLKSTDPQTRENAACMALIQATGIRPGSSADTKAAKQAYGATTLEGRHVVIDGGSVRLKFTGKKGVDLDIPVADPQVASLLRERKRNAGDTGKLFGTDAAKLRDYSHTLDGGSFKPKDFRTLVGTRTALDAIQAAPKRASSMKEFKDRVRAIAKQVAARLGNTPTIALQSYINPFVFDAIKPATP